MKRVNIFKYATSELSQDAFLCWLIENSNPQYADYVDLHAAACAFVKLLINKGISYDKPIENIRVRKQMNDIDVRFVVNEEIKVIIEDKIMSGEHSGQLERYKSDELKRLNGKQLVCIYLKTGNESRETLYKIIQKGYSIVNRRDILDLLTQYHPHNDFYIDYVEYLQSLEDKTNTYMNKPYTEWDYMAWQGFYMCIEKELKMAGWGYVSNPKGGFWGLHWYWTKKSDCEMYLQIENEGKLCIKIKVVEGNVSAIREKWHKKLMEQVKFLGYKEIQKPQRFGYGKWITIGIIDPKDYMGESLFNRDKVLKNIRKYEELIDKCVE